jgi:hypothetical protein
MKHEFLLNTVNPRYNGRDLTLYGCEFLEISRAIAQAVSYQLLTVTARF